MRIDKLDLRVIFYFVDTFILLIVVSFYRISKILMILICIPIALMLAYLKSFGVVNAGHITALLATNYNESFEFFKNFPLNSFYLTIVFIVLLYVYSKLKTYKLNKTSYTIIIILVLLFLLPYTFIKPVYKFTYWAYLDYEYQIKLIEKHKNDKVSFKIIQPINQKYHNYVVVIGESMPKQYTSLYGYPIKSTPFLDRVKGKIICDYLSAGQTTLPSLMRTITVYTSLIDNVITLAKLGNYKTYWISNQNQASRFNYDVTYITKDVDQSVFINSNFEKQGFYLSSSSHYDEELLPHFNKILNKNTESKVIFIHLMGSHPQLNKRVKGKPKFHTKISENIDYLLTTYKNTDAFLENIYKDLKQQQQPFSIIYFSDHGMSVTKDLFLHGKEYKQNYDVPFVMISSDDKEHTVIDKTISAFSFMDIYASWLGIKTNKTKYYKNLEDLPNNSNVQVFNGSKMFPYNQLDSLEVLKPMNK